MNSLHQPVFICGALRSGSTLLHLMLDHHPNIKNPGEFDFMFDLIKDDGSFPNLDDYHEFLGNNRIFKAKNLVIDASLTFPELLKSFISQLQQESKILALNVHRNFHRIPYVFSDAKYIHLLRDPRDVARSSIEMGWCGNVYFGVDHWIKTEHSWEKLEQQLKPGQYSTLYYEKLIEEPETVLTAICTFLNLPFSHQMLEYPQHSSYGRPDKSLIQQWKRKLSNRDIQHVETKAGDLMEQKGFQLSGLPKTQIGLLEKIKLAFQNKQFRVIFGIRRYGISLYASERLTKIFGLEKLHKEFVLARQEIDKKHLK